MNLSSTMDMLEVMWSHLKEEVADEVKKRDRPVRSEDDKNRIRLLELQVAAYQKELSDNAARMRNLKFRLANFEKYSEDTAGP